MEKSNLSLVHAIQLPEQPADGKPPALLMLHGRGSDEYDLLGLAAHLDRRLFIVSARAPFTLNPGYHWYDLQQIGAPEPKTFRQSVELLLRFIDDLPAAYGVDPKQIFLIGFSQGATMTGAVALSSPERIAGAIMLSGYLPLTSGLEVDAHKLAGRPFFVGHGTQDQVIPITFGRMTRDHLTSVHAALSYHEYPVAHQISWPELDEINRWLGERLATTKAQGA